MLFSDHLKFNNIIKEVIIERKTGRKTIFLNLLKFSIGDILILFY
jgi:hypothetical protein